LDKYGNVNINKSGQGRVFHHSVILLKFMESPS